jgi:hypothetical protein
MRKKLFLLPFLLALGIAALPTGSAAALSGENFQAGRIIDDGIFFNGASMDAGEIQRFLNVKVPNCDTNGQLPRGNVTRAEHGTANGYPPPYTCLKDYVQATPSKAAENGLCGQYDGGTKTAAQIISDVARACNVSPKVLIILLEKEQSLVTDDWPWSIQYRSATGYGCPDTAPCDAEYYGFFNQVYNAARQFKRYDRDATLFRYRAYRANYIQYNPNAGCGGTEVYVGTQATAGLYNYTPYQPNPPALANLYGTGDACSAYGNRNFWRLFSDWFGSTFTGARHATFYRHGNYPAMLPGQSMQSFFMYKNTGNVAWHDFTTAAPGGQGIVNLSTSSPINRRSNFGLGWGADQNRPTGVFSAVYESDGTTLTNNQHIVMPGQIAKFDFTFTAPPNAAPGVYREWFQPILEASPQPNISGLAFLDVTIIKPERKAAYHGQSIHPTITAGQSSQAYFMYKNVGTVAWHDFTTAAPGGHGIVNLAATSPLNRSSLFGASWGPDKNRPTGVFGAVYESDGTTLTNNQHIVMPGQIAKYNFTFTVPAGTPPGVYREWLQPILEATPQPNIGGIGWSDVTVQ